MKVKKDAFYRFLYLSVAFHLSIFTVLTVKILFFPGESPDYTQAVRIDVVALPEKNVEPPKPEPAEKTPEPVKEPEPPKPEPKPEPPKPKPKKIVKKPKPLVPKKKAPKKPKPVEKVEDEQNSALARLKALQKLKDQKKKDQPQEFKGNQISKGNSLTGLAKLHHESYLDDLDSHIRSFWNLPEWLANGNLKARIMLQIGKNGDIQGKTFVMKSGNDLFDQHVVTTLEKANPLPAPPANLVDFYATKGVEIRFPE